MGRGFVLVFLIRAHPRPSVVKFIGFLGSARAMNEEPLASNPIEPVPAESSDPALLDHIVDDFDAKRSWSDWAVDQMAAGRTAEEVAAELVANGWGEEDAAEMAEAARKATRHLRGAITREEVAGEYHARYRKGTALRWFSVFPSFASLWRLLNSVGGLRKSRRPMPRKDSNAAGQQRDE
jgi:hypothetical protein